MSNSKNIISLLVSLLLFAVFSIPLFNKGIKVLEKPVPANYDIVKLVSNTLWLYRIPEIYFHAFFLSATIIASLLALRKPPKFVPEATPEEIGVAYVGFETVAKEGDEE